MFKPRHVFQKTYHRLVVRRLAGGAPARGRAVVAALALAASVVPGCGSDEAVGPDASTAVSELASGQGAVHGYVDTRLATTFGLPDATVQLKRTSDNVVTATAKTNVHGAFIAANVPAATYVICLTATQGFSSVCSSASFAVAAGKIAYPAHAVFTPLRFTVSGRVRLSNSADVWYENDLFSKEVNTFVKALTPGGTLVSGPVRANSRGEYVLRQLPGNTSYRIVATSEATSVESVVALASAPVTRDLSLPNRRPVVSEVDALQNGSGARHVAAGSTVQVQVSASDPDGQALHYRWIAPHGGVCPASDAAAVSCTMPTAQGIQAIYVQVSDGVGQYAVGRVQVTVGPALSLFAGSVVTDGNVAVAGAEVKVNGVSPPGVRVLTNATGGFSITVPEKNRFVLTIKKDGFQMFSKVVLAERTGAVYKLLQADSSIIDPRIDNTVHARAPRSATGDPSGYRDITILLRANTIVDSTGTLVTTPVTVYRSRFDHLFDPFDRMPGDTGATDTLGADVTLTSYGAVEVTLRGPTGENYNLDTAHAKLAHLDYPVHPSQLAGAPATLPLWYYDDDTGLWNEDGVATLVTTGTGSSYSAEAKHFTAVNVDLKKKDATCLKVVVDTVVLHASTNHPIKVRLAVPGFPVRDREVTENVTAIVRLPPNVAGATLVVLDDTTNAPIAASLRTFTTGDKVPDGTNLDLAPPFNVCITPPSPPVTLTLDLPQNPSLMWLTRMINPGASDVERSAYADAYYKAIKADVTDTTLTAWKGRNGFDDAIDPAAFYFNAGDLELGRSMHMHTTPTSIAYYVTNFDDADKAFGGAAADVRTTVAMEYSKYPLPAGLPGPKFMKFYVFNAQGNLVNRAELDNRGDKYVPGLCIVCHGGTVPPDITAATPAGNTESRFLPFDLSSFETSPLAGGFPALKPRDQQEDNFRKLNEGLYSSSSAPTAAQIALIEAWYDDGVGSVSVPGTKQNDDADHIPQQWAALPADKSFYNDVVRPSCRGCHTSRASSPANPGPDFGDPTSFVNSSPQGAVCNAGYMPQSFVAWRNLWRSSSPRQPTRIEQYLNLGAGTCVGQ